MDDKSPSPTSLRVRAHKDGARTILGGRCASCGTTEQLEFDHIDCRTKTLRTQDVFKSSWARVERELPFLQLLCHPCHNDKSRSDRWIKVGQRPYWVHGTATGYYHKGCRCDGCREAMRSYARRRRERVVTRDAAAASGTAVSDLGEAVGQATQRVRHELTSDVIELPMQVALPTPAPTRHRNQTQAVLELDVATGVYQ